jgi:hypothetical protein
MGGMFEQELPLDGLQGPVERHEQDDSDEQPYIATAKSICKGIKRTDKMLYTRYTSVYHEGHKNENAYFYMRGAVGDIQVYSSIDGKGAKTI